MVRRIIGLINREISGLHEAAYLLAIFAFSSQLLGLVRDRFLAGTFGTSHVLDVYYASFRIPDLLFVLVSAFVSASVLVPIFSSNISNRETLKKYIDSLLTIFVGAISVLIILAIIFTPWLLKFVAPGLVGGESSGDLILFTRILLVSPLLLGVSQLFGGIVQSYKKFAIYAISPILYNAGIIVGVVLFYPIFGNIGLIFGVCLGLVLHLVVQLPTIAERGLIPSINFRPDLALVRSVAKLSLPRTIAMTSSQLTLIVLIGIASTMVSGSIAIFNLSFNLQSVPMSIIGVSYSLAAFPTLSRLFSDGNLEKFMAHIINSARHIIFWSLPVMVMFIVLRAQIVRTVLGAGEFNWSDTRLTAAALAIFIVSALAQSLILLFVRGYYSAGQTKKPLYINIFSAVFTIAISYWLVDLYNSTPPMRAFFERLLRVDGGFETSILMLPLAYTLGMTLNVILLWISFEKNFRGFSKNLFMPLFQSLAASLVGGYVAYVMLQVFDDVFNLNKLHGIFAQGLFSGVIGLAVIGTILWLIGNQEIREVAKTLHQKIWKSTPITTGQEEL